MSKSEFLKACEKWYDSSEENHKENMRGLIGSIVGDGYIHVVCGGTLKDSDVASSVYEMIIHYNEQKVRQA